MIKELKKDKIEVAGKPEKKLLRRMLDKMKGRFAAGALIGSLALSSCTFDSRGMPVGDSSARDGKADIVALDLGKDAGRDSGRDSFADVLHDTIANDVLDPDTTQVPWWNSSWKKRVACKVNTKVSSNLTDFPAGIVIDTASLISAAKMQSGCGDLRVIDTDDKTQLDHEVEAGTCNTQNTVVWFRIPLTNGANDYLVGLYYGNPSASNGENVGGVWSNGFVSVWHGGDLKDSLGKNDLTAVGTVTSISDQTQCKFGKCFELSQNSYLEKTSGNYPTSQLTLSAWGHVNASPAGNDRTIISLGIASNNAGIALYRSIINDLVADIYWGGTLAVIPNYDIELLDKKTYYAAGYNGAATSILYNLANSSETGSSYSSLSSGNPIRLGRYLGSNTRYWATSGTAILDEVRISSVARSSDWLKAEYSQSYILGNEESK